MTSLSRRSIVELLDEAGLQLSPEALDYIVHLESPMQAVEVVLESNGLMHPPILSKEYIESLLSLIQTESPWRVIIEKSPMETSAGSEGLIDDFLKLFHDRFERIREIYMSRSETARAITPTEARKLSTVARVAKRMAAEGMPTAKIQPSVVIGMVKNKTLSYSHNVIVELEDMEGSITCVIPTGKKGPQGREVSEKAAALLHDEVVCIKGRVEERELLIADDIIFPDIPPNRPMNRADRLVYAAFISDLHCGSREFLEKEFDRFIDWLNGEGVSDEDKDIVQRIRYLFIAGDLVDGISVYPGQRENLLLDSNMDQYALLASKLKRLPERLMVFCIPGNHDACRQALPKPPIPREFAEPLYKLDRIHMLGDPSQVNVEGVKVLITHGDSLDDMVTNLPGAKYTSPGYAMMELLRKRHLAPIYGGKTELAPLSRDWLVIDTPPDVVHFGHAHHIAVSRYKNSIQVINSGTFQSQTDFMRRQGVDPTPGIVTLLNLKTGEPTLRYFMDEIVKSM